jgi:dihydroorotate dehydrogenase (fumarate)
MDLSCTYMGLPLQTPIIAGSSGLSSTFEQVAKLAEAGAGAVVLKSIFEEQILAEADALSAPVSAHAEEMDYLRAYTRQENLGRTLDLIRRCRAELSIPIIASINCQSASEWTGFAREMENAGAHGLELNLFLLPGNFRQDGPTIEAIYFDIIDKVRQTVKIPIALKVSSYFSSLGHTLYQFSVRDIKGLVLFNRFVSPDIDIETETLTTAHLFSTPAENAMTLRWIALLNQVVKCDLCASTGIHDGKTLIKNLLAGARAGQVVSAIYKHGPAVITEMKEELLAWMKHRRYHTIGEFRGKLSHQKMEDPSLYERVQFMKTFSNHQQ